MKKVIEVNVETNAPTGVITFDMEDGKDPIVFDTSKLDQTAVTRLMLHGASQKIGDSAANAAKQENPVAWAREQVQATVDQLYGMKSFADWRAASGGGGPRVTDLAVALSRLTGKPLEAVVELVEGLTDDQKKEYRAKAKVKAMLASIAAEKAIERAKKAQAAAEAGDADAGKDEEDVTI